MKNKNPPLSSSPSETEQKLLEALLTLRTIDEMQRFLRDLCTPKEIQDLADRWWTACLLDAGKHSYRAIHQITGVSVTTVGRVARFLQQEHYHGYRLVLDRIKKITKDRR